MRLSEERIALIGVIACSGFLLATAPATDEPKPDKDGFVSLFDGKTLDGWKIGKNAGSWKVEDGHLVVTFPFRPQPLALEPISETEFDMPTTDGRFTFRKDQQGRVTGVLFRVGDGERDMKRVAP